MSYIGVTGDMHGEPRSIRRLSAKNFPLGKVLTKEDVVIIAGDFGMPFDGSDEENYWLDWLNNKPFTVAFVDGNHENFDRLYNCDIASRFGAPVTVIRPSVLHLRRGNIYNICGNSIFTMGGGKSVDKEARLRKEQGFKTRMQSAGAHEYRPSRAKPRPRSLWWPEEYPTHDEWDYAWKNLARVNFSVDYVITHVPPARFIDWYSSHHTTYDKDFVSMHLQDMFDVIKCQYWYHGHMHVDAQEHHKVISLYNKVVEIGKDIV